MSTQEQAQEGHSLAAQAEKFRAHCRVRELAVVEELVDEGVSAGKPLARRPGGQRLLELVRTRAVDTVVVWSLDRAFRNTAECLTTVEAWKKRGVALHLLNFGGQVIDTSSAVGKVFLTVIAAFAEFERNINAERTSLALRHKKAKSEYLGGEARYGWRVVGWREDEPGSGHVERDEDEQRIIARAKALRAEGLGVRRIATLLASEGVRSRRGKPFAPVQIERMCAP